MIDSTRDDESFRNRLRELCVEGKSVGVEAHSIRSDILTLKERIDSGENETEGCLDDLIRKRARYDNLVSRLREIKCEIANIKAFMARE